MTTHDLLEDAARLLEGHGWGHTAELIRTDCKGTIPNVPLAGEEAAPLAPKALPPSELPEALDAACPMPEFTKDGEDVTVDADAYVLLRSFAQRMQSHLDRLTGMKFSDRMHAALVSRAESAERQLAEVREENERLHVQLAGCGVAALQNTPESVGARAKPGDYGYSESYAEVCRAVDREIELRTQLETRTGTPRALAQSPQGGEDRKDAERWDALMQCEPTAIMDAALMSHDAHSLRGALEALADAALSSERSPGSDL